MILFYNKQTGEIHGHIQGRVHNEMQLNMWIGDKEHYGRIVVQFIVDEKGNYVPDHPQKDIIMELDQEPIKMNKYLVNTKTLELTIR